MVVKKKDKSDFQTPVPVANYMASMIPEGIRTLLEPTPGNGNLVKAAGRKYIITAPENYFELPAGRFDCVLMNPPFSQGSAFGVPDHLGLRGMGVGYWILNDCLRRADNVIALMPWFTISDSDVRLRSLMRWGLISVTALPRSTFGYTRIQTVVLQLQKGYGGVTAFRAFDLRHEKKMNYLCPG